MTCRIMRCSDGAVLGTVATYGMDSVRDLAKRPADLLAAVCMDDIGSVERAISSGTRHMCVRLMRDPLRELSDEHPGASVDLFAAYGGEFVRIPRRMAEAAFVRACKSLARPYGMPEEVASAIVSGAGGKCAVCGRNAGECGSLGVLDLMPWDYPYIGPPGRCYWIRTYESVSSASSACVAACGDCRRAWRQYFDENLRKSPRAWFVAHGIKYADYLVQGGLDWPENTPGQRAAAVQFREAVRRVCLDRIEGRSIRYYIPRDESGTLLLN